MRHGASLQREPFPRRREPAPIDTPTRPVVCRSCWRAGRDACPFSKRACGGDHDGRQVHSADNWCSPGPQAWREPGNCKQKNLAHQGLNPRAVQWRRRESRDAVIIKSNGEESAAAASRMGQLAWCRCGITTPASVCVSATEWCCRAPEKRLGMKESKGSRRTMKKPREEMQERWGAGGRNVRLPTGNACFDSAEV